jgi:molecular chaperone DnaK (HSP70)
VGTAAEKPCDSAAVLKAKAHLPYQFETTSRGSVAVRRNATAVLTVEEINAMLFGHVKAISSSFAGNDVKDAVITVPTFYSQKERRAMINSAELAGLNILGLINENTAFALQYAINYDFNPNKTTHAIFYNMGASSTQVSLFRFSAEMVKGKITRTCSDSLSVKIRHVASNICIFACFQLVLRLWPPPGTRPLAACRSTCASSITWSTCSRPR